MQTSQQDRVSLRSWGQEIKPQNHWQKQKEKGNRAKDHGEGVIRLISVVKCATYLSYPPEGLQAGTIAVNHAVKMPECSSEIFLAAQGNLKWITVRWKRSTHLSSV